MRHSTCSSNMAAKQVVFLTGLLLLAYAAGSPADYEEIDVCNGSEIVCLNDTVVQKCQEQDGSQHKFVQLGNPYVCNPGQICNETETPDGCSTPKPFACNATGTFPDPAVCTKYHKCTVTSSYTQHTIYQCTGGKLYSCRHKNCVAASLATESCSVCRQKSR